MANDVVLNQVLVGFGSSERTDAVVAAVQREGTCWASQIPVAMPQPTSAAPSRIERGLGVRLDQPNFSAASAAFMAAIRLESRRFICPAPIPAVAPSLA